ncbi:MAG: hypothetical protein KatS3mg029_0276 [Saprospiraceae bacterium]|nr:MAG: hypothetical protein KatS3mg029_0276 [Saprospiraceae bacterium]
MPLYFIAVLPGEEIQQEVMAFKQYCCTHFGACHALKSPPHITLVPPHRWAEEVLPQLEEVLDLFALGQEPFEVELQDFAAFAPRVIYVDVSPNPSLRALHRHLLAKLERSMEFRDERAHRFHPHMTIAHRDLDRQAFRRAWAHFSLVEYRRRFTVDQLVLLEHRDKRWHIRRAFPFG